MDRRTRQIVPAVLREKCRQGVFSGSEGSVSQNNEDQLRPLSALPSYVNMVDRVDSEAIDPRKRGQKRVVLRKKGQNNADLEEQVMRQPGNQVIKG
jgi:hypothetical protein